MEGRVVKGHLLGRQVPSTVAHAQERLGAADYGELDQAARALEEQNLIPEHPPWVGAVREHSSQRSSEAEGRATGWEAYLVDMDDDEQDDVVFFCPACATREFRCVELGDG